MNLIIWILGVILSVSTMTAAPAAAVAQPTQVHAWQIAARPMFLGCDKAGRNVYSIEFNNDMYDNPQTVTVRGIVRRNGKVVRRMNVRLSPHEYDERRIRVSQGEVKRFTMRVNGEVGTDVRLKGENC